jgi:pimeloyl-ACP methyl ester carboxylesterase
VPCRRRAGDAEQLDAGFRRLQEDHATRSSDSRLVVAEDSRHYVYLDEPELVVDALRGLVGGG